MKSRTEEVSARFDHLTADWDTNPGRIALAKGVVNAIRSAVPLYPNMNTIDFGAGTGLVTLGLLPYLGHLTAVDASHEMARLLEGKVKALDIAKVQPLSCDVATFPFPEAEFDLIVSSMALHHISDVPQTLRRLRPCLRPGGWIALADLDSDDGSFHSDSTGVFHHGLNRDKICGWLQESRFVENVFREARRMMRSTAEGKPHEYPVLLVTSRAG